MYDPLRGSIWYADFSPTKGSEQYGKRPALVVSSDIFNGGPSGVLIVLPLTRTDRRISFHVQIDPESSGLNQVSFAMCDQVRAISKRRLLDRTPAGSASDEAMQQVERMLGALLEI